MTAIHLTALRKTTAKIDALVDGRNELIRAAAAAGFSNAQIAEAAGLTRQRVWQLLRK